MNAAAWKGHERESKRQRKAHRADTRTGEADCFLTAMGATDMRVASSWDKPAA
jgi:hypothetical protein